MMGEYILFYQVKIVGGIYDNRLLVKPVKSAVSLIPYALMNFLMKGAKEMLLADDVDDRNFLAKILRLCMMSFRYRRKRDR